MDKTLWTSLDELKYVIRDTIRLSRTKTINPELTERLEAIYDELNELQHEEAASNRPPPRNALVPYRARVTQIKGDTFYAYGTTTSKITLN